MGFSCSLQQPRREDKEGGGVCCMIRMIWFEIVTQILPQQARPEKADDGRPLQVHKSTSPGVQVQHRYSYSY